MLNLEEKLGPAVIGSAIGLVLLVLCPPTPFGVIGALLIMGAISGYLFCRTSQKRSIREGSITGVLAGIILWVIVISTIYPFLSFFPTMVTGMPEMGQIIAIMGEMILTNFLGISILLLLASMILGAIGGAAGASVYRKD